MFVAETMEEGFMNILVNSLTEKTFSLARSGFKRITVDKIKVLMCIVIKFELLFKKQ